ncbi:Sodium nucleoside cotransporter [Brachionus plicatilis]|uniref:Sodium nucleoside cotransporter n=1 Tax=Brachionus plicatilis TaxID=10195 RepID=A0A3M7SVE7_BRAPC|nr:Sodium nucleoside cotransporter [Brachionus plicatilis]
MQSTSRSSIGKNRIIPGDSERTHSLELDQISKKAQIDAEQGGIPNEEEFDTDDENEVHDLTQNRNYLALGVIKFRLIFTKILKQKHALNIILGLAIVGFWVYFGFAMAINNPFIFTQKDDQSILQNWVFSGNRGLALLVVTTITTFLIFWDNIFKKYIKFPNLPKNSFFEKLNQYLAWILMTIIFIVIAIYLAFSIKETYNLVSLIGLASFVLLSILMSAHPSKINWRILFAGLQVQFVLGVVLMRTEFGYQLFKFLSEQVTIFLGYTDRGTNLVFGSFLVAEKKYFAFKSIPVIIFFSAVINILYYFGFVQYLILKLAWLVNLLMGTSPTESMNATANIFLGITEAPLLIKPFLEKMTRLLNTKKSHT